MPLAIPRVRSDLEFFEQEVEGRPVVLVRDPVRGIYVRFNPLQGAMLRALDGVRSIPELVDTLSEQFETELPAEAVERFLEQARDQLLLDFASYKAIPHSVTERVLAQLARSGLRLQPITQDDDTASVTSAGAGLFVAGLRQLQGGDPARALDYFHAVLELDPGNARAKTLANAITAAYVRALSAASTDWPTFPLFDPTPILRFLDRTVGKLVFRRWSWLLLIPLVALGLYCYATTTYPTFHLRYTDLILAYFLVAIHAFSHEMGHGVTCHHYGGTVREVGVMMFYYVSIDPYCDTSSTYLFTNRTHKVYVQAAGSVVTLVFACVLSILLAVLEPHVFIYQALEITIVFLLLSLIGLVVPLIKLDGYYALCDYLDIPNLRERSFNYLKATIGTFVLGLDDERERVSKRRRVAYLTFAILSVVFTVWFVYFSLTNLIAPIVEKFRGPGLVLSVALFGYIARSWLRPVGRFCVLLVRERRKIFTRRRGGVVLGMVAVLAVPCAIPRSVRVDADFVLVPKLRVEARAEAAGLVDEVLVHEGDVVAKGQPLAILRDHELPEARQVVTIRSPIAGVVATKDLELRRGARLESGATFAEIHDVSAFVAELQVAGSSPLGEIAPGDEIRLRATGAPDHDITCQLASTRVEKGDTVLVTTPFALAGGRAAMMGNARVFGREHSLAYSMLYTPIQTAFRVKLWSMF